MFMIGLSKRHSQQDSVNQCTILQEVPNGSSPTLNRSLPLTMLKLTRENKSLTLLDFNTETSPIF